MSKIRFAPLSPRHFRWFAALLLVVAGPVFALSAPGSPQGVEVSQSTVKWSWDPVPGVQYYEVTVDGQLAEFTRDPQLYSGNLWAGDHSMTVQALLTDGRRTARSATAKIVVSASYNPSSPARSIEVGGPSPSSSGSSQGASASNAPTSSASTSSSTSSGSAVSIPGNPRGREVGQGVVEWEWDWVPGAAQYEVTVDGGVAGTTQTTNFFSENLWAGDHSLTVKAIAADGQYSGSSQTAKIVVNANYNAGNPAQSYLVGSAPAGVSSSSSTSGAATAPPPPAPEPVADDNGLVDVRSWSIPEASKAGYDLVFSDEFNGGSLNPVRWNTQLRWDGEWNGERYEYRVINNEDQFYVNVLSDDQGHRDTVVPAHNPFEFNGSRLAIRAVKNPLKLWDGGQDYGSLFDMVSQQTFLSGAITTYDKFTQKYGYFEARMKIPSHIGTFPAFWLHHQRRRWEGTRRTEIDIMENLGHAPWYIYNSFHYFNDVSVHYGGNPNHIRPYPDGQIYTGTDYSQNYHTYAVKWEPGYIAWYIDGNLVSEVWNGNADHEELYLILNLAMGGNWTNYPANSGGLGRAERYPSASDLAPGNFNSPALEIDYVRVYRKR